MRKRERAGESVSGQRYCCCHSVVVVVVVVAKKKKSGKGVNTVPAKLATASHAALRDGSINIYTL